MPTLVVNRFREDVVSGWASAGAAKSRHRGLAMVCAGDDVKCVAGEARAGAMAGGVTVVADEPSDVDSNRAVAASAGDSVVVSGVLTAGEEGF